MVIQGTVSRILEFEDSNIGKSSSGLFKTLSLKAILKVKYAIVNLVMRLNIMSDKYFVTKNMIIMALLLAGIENVLPPNVGKRIIWARKYSFGSMPTLYFIYILLFSLGDGKKCKNSHSIPC